jgi:hypothetical protein
MKWTAMTSRTASPFVGGREKMRFVDAYVFIYAVLSPKRAIPDRIRKRKETARKIFLRINEVEDVITSTVHMSEVANVLEDIAGISFATDLLSAVFAKSTIVITPVSSDI